MIHLKVVAAILWKGETFLAAKRPPKKVLAGYWEFPGGKCEKCEEPKAALCRELKEELNIDVVDALFWQELNHTYSEEQLHVQLFFFFVRSYQGIPQSNEGQRIRWMTPNEALQHPFLPADQTILTQLNSLRLLEKN
ncbi:MAG: (deoxy)nucleoside triphosphate pyrophosphohydrolase [Desulfovibrio sp.]|nr:(deoxy)nucleoside triphosphate pyrophosphohydrolase [Desulfovibrio sp.]